MPAASVPADEPDTVRACVRIRLRGRTAPAAFEAWLLERTSVRAVWLLTGDFDYEVRLTCTSLRDLTDELHAMRHSGAEQTDTCLLLREVTAAGSDHLMED